MRRTIAHLVLGVLGLAGLGWALVWGASPVITCRDQVMGPGDTCTHAQSQVRIQTYEERLTAAQQARPVVAVASLAVVGLAGWLLVAETRRKAQASRLIGP